MFGWLLFLRAGCKPGFGPAAELLFFSKAKKKASHVRAASRCLALLAAFGALANSSPEMSTPLNRLRRFPLQGTTPAARQSRFRGVPGRGCASLAGEGISLLNPHKGTARRATTPSPLIPHTSLLIMGNHKACPYTLPPHSSPLIPHSSLLIPHPSLHTRIAPRLAAGSSHGHSFCPPPPLESAKNTYIIGTQGWRVLIPPPLSARCLL